MKHIITISLLMIAFQLFAVDQEPGMKQQDLPVQKLPVTGLNSENPDSLIKHGNTDYMQGNYDAAIKAYKSVIDQGYEAAELYYNLGNAYFKLHDIPHAILNYERARILDPTNEDINFNLEKARTYVVDKIDAVPEFIIYKWFRTLINMTTSNSWAIIGFVAFVVLLLFLLIYFFTRNITMKRLSFWSSILFLVISLITLSFSNKRKQYMKNNNGAVIMSPTVTVKGSPNDSGTNLFILHEGTTVNVTDSLGDWNEIKIRNGNQGWILKSDLERI
jgi:tetratricopeptide (TPR) repeat protein